MVGSMTLIDTPVGNVMSVKSASGGSWSAEKFAEYGTSHQMENDQLALKFTGAHLEAANDNHEAALALLEDCETLAGPELRRVLLDVLAARAQSLDALGRTDDATSTRTRAQSVADEIAALIRDEELRAAFQQGTRSLLSPVPTS